MTVQIAICDDSEEDSRILSAALYAYNDAFKIFYYKDGQSLLDDCDEKETIFDIIFLDIYMSGLNGIETAKKIRSDLRDVKIIFISSSNDYYSEAYDVFAFNYIIKPLNREKLNRILDQALVSIANMRSQEVSFRYKSVNYRIFCSDILYLESRDKIIYFHLKDRTTLQCYAKLDEILKQLPEEYLIRCHQSFVVNISHATEMAEKFFRIGTTVINISKKYRKESKDKYFAYLFNHMKEETVR